METLRGKQSKQVALYSWIDLFIALTTHLLIIFACQFRGES